MWGGELEGREKGRRERGIEKQSKIETERE